MTLTEAQTLRTAYMTALTAIVSGGASSYSIGGIGVNKTVTKIDITQMTSEIAKLDQFIDRMGNGMFGVVQFRGHNKP